MKKKLIVSLVSVFMASPLASFAAGADKVTVDGGKIHFAGSIVAAPCAVDNDSTNQTITLGQVPVNNLASTGDASAAIPFSIKLLGCDLAVDTGDPENPANYTSVSITFSGATAGDDSTLALVAGSAGETIAKNVGVQILQNDQPVKVDGSTPTATAALDNGNNEIPFSAVYVATMDGAVAGSANALVDFKVNYE